MYGHLRTPDPDPDQARLAAMARAEPERGGAQRPRAGDRGRVLNANGPPTPAGDDGTARIRGCGGPDDRGAAAAGGPNRRSQADEEPS